MPSLSLVRIRVSLRFRLRLKLKRLRSRLRLVWVKIYTSTGGWLGWVVGCVGGEMGIKANLSQS